MQINSSGLKLNCKVHSKNISNTLQLQDIQLRALYYRQSKGKKKGKKGKYIMEPSDLLSPNYLTLLCLTTVFAVLNVVRENLLPK